jgi:ATPase subunit of ABC transporter with duplicated ATPase domains
MRSADAKDHDAHSTARKGRHPAGEAAAGRSVTVARAERDRLAGRLEENQLERSVGRDVTFAGEAAARRTLVRLEGRLSAGGRVLVDRLDLAVDRTDRIQLAGPNGAGKSTLLEMIVASWDLPAERLSILPQELGPTRPVELLDSLSRLPRPRRGRVLELYASLGSDPDVLLASRRPSPGEARKLVLAFGLGTETWMLGLDEPTNHLDLPTVERLESALSSYPGALVVVTHDGELAERVTDTSWSIDPANRTLTVS